MFVGASYRIRLGGRASEPRARAAFGLSPMITNGLGQLRIGSGLEFSPRRGDTLALSIAGIDSKQLIRSSNLSGAGKVALIAGGILLVGAGVVVLVARDQMHCDDDGDGDQETCD